MSQIAKRTIMTPGPVEAEPRVLRAMSAPILGQFDPAFTEMMNETMAMLRKLFQTNNHWAYPIDGTSRSGLEAVLTSLIEPGDRVFVPIYGRFGHLLVEICERLEAEVHTIECEWGTVFSEDKVIAEFKKVQPKILACVHGETSTGCLMPLERIGRACRDEDVLFVVDAVATIGGVEFKVDDWFVDAAIGGTQKCLSVPSGMAPITYNSRAEAVINRRKKVERGIATEQDQTQPESTIIRSNYFDLSQLQDYWSPRRLNHHTEATSMIYGLHEGLRVLLEEGLQSRFERHIYHEKALIAGIKAMGLELYVEHEQKLPVVTCVTVPNEIDADAVRSFMLTHFGVEIASSFGPLHGKIWRIGSMGYSCRKENILFALSALEATLLFQGAAIESGKGVQAALRYYEA
ncbi:(S)-ureidoglycine-glyoxylate aminotransferase [Alkalihalobacillus xiaoxiensis]|uniref:(S)-ureidoglycine-glyoxylate aminotransferase n=1 Tax=Shouchella xiaoxiensis TaxID=766895 RepID=A0ABS2SRD2_9BACI|nr:alanine--glyoxylate aminotransferase family protein [Shouchella xiaoxiensis]MBM7837800.1 (S)-ureidoglycine-glyoxylate aminotransferase [Shouchella xiaoxiensis]